MTNTGKRRLGVFGTGVIMTLIAVAIVWCVAGAVREATEPVPGWKPTPTATTKK
jgi:hypothetical protein